MASERNGELKAYADKLRGINPQALGQVNEAGKVLVANGVGKGQNVSGNAALGATPRLQQDQGGGNEAHRHILDAKQQQLVGGPPGGQAQQAPAAAKAPPEQSAAVAKESDLQAIAAKMRKSGVAGKQSGNQVAGPSPTQQQSPQKGRGL